MGQFYEYLWAFISYWWALLAGGLLAMDSTLEHYFGERYRRQLNKLVSAKTRRRSLFLLTIVAVFFAGFLAWKDEHKKVSELEEKLTELKTAQSNTANLERNLENTRRELDEAKNQIGKLQARQVPRRLTQEQKARLISKLRGKDEGRIITIKTVDGVPPEAFKYAEDFIYIIKTAGWTFNRFWGWWFLRVENVAVISHPNDPVAVFLQSVLREEGIEARLFETKKVEKNNIDIVIGPKA